MEETYKAWLKDPKNRLLSFVMHRWMPKDSKPSKSLIQAKCLRAKAVCLYPSSNLQDHNHVLLELYTKSIAHSPANSRLSALSYEKLSALLFQLEKHSECLQAIDSFFDSKYPEGSKFELLLRKIECLKIINEPLKAKEAYEETLAWIETQNRKAELKDKLETHFKKEVEIKLPYTNEEIDQIWNEFSIKSFNQEIPGLSKALNLKYNESQGRHYVAGRDIKPGEMLMQDRPYAVICTAQSRYRSCWECCKSVTNCIPCDHCENVIFCSKECKKKAWEEYHYVECQLLPFFFNLPDAEGKDSTDGLIAAFRLLLIAIKEYGSLQKLKEAVNEMEQNFSTDPRTQGFENGKLVVDKYMGLMYLKSHFEHFEDTIPVIVTAIMYEIATTTSVLGEKMEPNFLKLINNEDFVFATCVFARHLDIVKVNRLNRENCFPWTGYTGATCLSIPASFFNHSCGPNAFIVQTKDCAKVVAMRPIKRGEQVFIDYLGNGVIQKEERQNELRAVFNFSCKCDICTNDWPVPSDYPNLYDLPAKYTKFLLSAYDVISFPTTAVERMSLKHDLSICNFYESGKDILNRFSKSIEKLDGNVPKCCYEVYLFPFLLYEFCMKLHSAYM